jgi:hypothetical protein
VEADYCLGDLFPDQAQEVWHQFRLPWIRFNENQWYISIFLIENSMGLNRNVMNDRWDGMGL